MKIKVLHIVSLDVPFPPDYGGVIDIYFRAKALKEQGIYIILHCFEYGRGTQHDWQEIADEVHFYPRKLFLSAHIRREPFIVATRKSNALVKRLLADEHPVLLEGQHCTGLLADKRLKDKLLLVRMHNVEWKYYQSLAGSGVPSWKRFFFRRESRKLRKFEHVLSEANALFCLSLTELTYYRSMHPNVHLWPVGCDFHRSEHLPEPEHFALFHGNLSVPENEKAVRWIVEGWQREKLEKPLVVAGKNPSAELARFLSGFPFVTLKASPSPKEMLRLVQTAEAHLLITFQATGVKLKLINTLLHGNRCIVNREMVEGTHLAEFCEVIATREEMAAKINAAEVSVDREKRLAYLEEHYDPAKNATRFLEIVAKL